MPRPRLLAPALLALASLAACDTFVAGNGVFREETRTVDPFDGIDVGYGIEATVTGGAATRSVVISGDENVIQYIATRVEGGVLTTRLEGTGDFTSVHPLRLVVSTPELVSVRAFGDARVDVTGASAPAFRAAVTERSVVTLAGAGGASLEATLSGGARLDAHGYRVGGAQVTLTGASRAHVYSDGDVTGTAEGQSVVEVEGGGACLVVLTSGATCGSP
jgi:hypothetical protein